MEEWQLNVLATEYSALLDRLFWSRNRKESDRLELELRGIRNRVEVDGQSVWRFINRTNRLIIQISLLRDRMERRSHEDTN